MNFWVLSLQVTLKNASMKEIFDFWYVIYEPICTSMNKFRFAKLFTHQLFIENMELLLSPLPLIVIILKGAKPSQKRDTAFGATGPVFLP